MTWLVVFDNGAWHVVPTDEEGEILSSHMPHPDCPCHPVIEITETEDEDEEASVLLIHNQIH